MNIRGLHLIDEQHISRRDHSTNFQAAAKVNISGDLKGQDLDTINTYIVGAIIGRQWCRKNIVGHWSTDGITSEFLFEHESEAMQFWLLFHDIKNLPEVNFDPD